MTSALDMPEIMSYIYNKSWKLQFSASSSIIIIEDFYLQTFLHSLVFAAELSEMIEFDLKTNEMKTVEIEEQNRSLSLNFMFQCPLIHEIYE